MSPRREELAAYHEPLFVRIAATSSIQLASLVTTQPNTTPLSGALRKHRLGNRRDSLSSSEVRHGSRPTHWCCFSECGGSEPRLVATLLYGTWAFRWNRSS